MTAHEPKPEPSPFIGWMRRRFHEATGDSHSPIGRTRSRFAGVVYTVIAIIAGACVAFLLVLLAWALPNLSSLVVGFAGGVLIGSALTLMLASRYPFLRKFGGFAILLAPLVVLASPFLLIGAAFLLLRRTRPAAEPTAAGTPDDPIVVSSVPERTARVPARRKSPRKRAT